MKEEVLVLVVSAGRESVMVRRSRVPPDVSHRGSSTPPMWVHGTVPSPNCSSHYACHTRAELGLISQEMVRSMRLTLL